MRSRSTREKRNGKVTSPILPHTHFSFRTGQINQLILLVDTPFLGMIPSTISNRIQRWALTLSMYEYLVLYKSSSTRANADALSRLRCTFVSSDPPLPLETVLVLEQILESPVTVDQIRSWSRKDPVISKVIRCTQTGWPRQLDSSATDLKPYWNRKLELSPHDGLLLWRNRVVVPPPSRSLILEELHTCHPGIAHMKALARMCV